MIAEFFFLIRILSVWLIGGGDATLFHLDLHKNLLLSLSSYNLLTAQCTERKKVMNLCCCFFGMEQKEKALDG